MIELILLTQLNTFDLTDYHKVKVLNSIKQVESRNCQDVKHKVMKKGIHRGVSALGCYGLMPNTIKSLLNDNEDATKVMTSFHTDNSLNQVLSIDDIIAERLYNKLNLKYKGDTSKVIYSWLNGSVNKRYSKKHWYVKKVLKNLK